MNTVLARLFHGHADAVPVAVGDKTERLELQQVTFPDLTWDHFHLSLIHI